MGKGEIMLNEKRVALVTGSSDGIGKAIAIELSKRNTIVIVNYNRNKEKALDTLSEIKKLGGEASAVKADVSNEKEVLSMFNLIKKEYGQLDILVNNAGIIKDNYLLMMSKSTFYDVIETNLMGCFYCTKAALRIMCSQKQGAILNISSTSGLIGQEGQANYSASKGGIISFTKSVAKEYAKYNIRANVICPGFIDTNMTKPKKELLISSYGDLIPLKRFGKPEEVACAARFLLSEDSSYITGQVLTVDGGLVM